MSSVSPLSSSSTPTTTASTGTSTGTSTAGSSSSASGVSSLITSTGIGSGLDITSIVASLTTSFGAAQSAQLNQQQTTLNSQVSAYSQFTTSVDKLKSAVSNLEVSSKLVGFAATVGDDSIASATTDTSAVAGSYTLQVNNLATSATLTSKAFTSATSGIGTGTLNVTVGGKTSSISVDSSNNTLQGIVSSINSAPDNPGVTASILTTSEGARLVLSSASTGAANAITVSQTGGDGNLAALAYDPANPVTGGLTQTQAAQDASFLINGFAGTSSSNVVTGALTGVSISLLAASAANTPTTLNIAPDTTNAQKSISDFTDALNDTISTIQSLTSYDPTTGAAGPLNGNATLQSFQNQLQSILGRVTTPGSNGVKSLADLGLTASADGSYSLDATKLGNLLTGNLAGVTGLLTGPNGLASQLDTFINGYTKTGGILDTINQGLLTGLKSVSTQQTALNTQLSAYSARLTAQYNAMDAAVAQLKLTQQYLTAQFNASSSSSSSSTSSLGSGSLST